MRKKCSVETQTLRAGCRSTQLRRLKSTVDYDAARYQKLKAKLLPSGKPAWW